MRPSGLPISLLDESAKVCIREGIGEGKGRGGERGGREGGGRGGGGREGGGRGEEGGEGEETEREEWRASTSGEYVVIVYVEVHIFV